MTGPINSPNGQSPTVGRSGNEMMIQTDGSDMATERTNIEAGDTLVAGDTLTTGDTLVTGETLVIGDTLVTGDTPGTEELLQIKEEDPEIGRLILQRG